LHKKINEEYLKAKLIYENIDFERGMGPKKSLNIGWARILSELKEHIRDHTGWDENNIQQMFIYCCRTDPKDASFEKINDYNYIDLFLKNEKIHQKSKDMGLNGVLGHKEINMDLIELLLKNGANPKYNDSQSIRSFIEGDAMYNYNRKTKNMHVLKRIIDAGADPTANNNLAMQVAASNFKYDILRFLLDYVTK